MVLVQPKTTGRRGSATGGRLQVKHAGGLSWIDYKQVIHTIPDPLPDDAANGTPKPAAGGGKQEEAAAPAGGEKKSFFGKIFG